MEDRALTDEELKAISEHFEPTSEVHDLVAEVRRLNKLLVNSLADGAVAGAKSAMQAAIEHFERAGDARAAAELRTLLDGMR